MASGPSESARRHAGSHGASQTLPHTDENGFVAVIASNASSIFPSQMYAMYEGASVPIGHATWHGAGTKWVSATSSRDASSGGTSGVSTRSAP